MLVAERAVAAEQRIVRVNELPYLQCIVRKSDSENGMADFPGRVRCEKRGAD